MADPKQNNENSENLLAGAFGVSAEDQAEIFAQIEQVAAQNRIESGPELFTVKAKKKGILVPLMINLGALGVLALGIFGLFILFQQGKSEVAIEGKAFTSAEGKLLQELKKEVEGKIQAKDEEITNIQKRLSNIDRERLDLQTNFDSKVRDKESLLRDQMNRELEAERARLKAQGLSEEAIRDRLNKFKMEQEARFNQQLQQYTRQAQEEKAALEANLKKTQEEFQSALQARNVERQRILAESQKRESELKAQLEEKARAADTQDEKTRAQLSSAMNDLAALNKQKEKLDNYEAQVSGFYSAAAKAIQGRKFPDALATIKSLKAFMAQPDALELTATQKRREADLALVSVLEDSIDAEVKRIEADSAKLGRTDDTVDTIKTLAAAADKEFAAGNTLKAEDYYLQALAKIPEVLASHEYFLKKKLQEDQVKQEKLTQGLNQAEAAFRAGRYQEAMTYYSLALEATPMGAVQRDAFLGRVQEAGYQIIKPLRNPPVPEPEPVKIPQTAFTEAEKLTAEKRYDEAIGVYVGMLEKYPQATQTSSVLTAIRKNAQSRAEAVPTGITTAQLATLQNDKANLEKALLELKEQSSKDKKELKVLESQITALNTEVTNLKKNQAVIATTTGTPPQNPGTMSKETEEEIARLTAVVAEYQRIKEKYKTYTDNEDKTLKEGQDSPRITAARAYLNEFLDGEEVRVALPGFKDRVGKYDRFNLEAGQKEVLFNITDIVVNLGKLTTDIERTAYLKNAGRRYKDNKSITDFIKSLETLMKPKS